jgi:two-component system invasion response regulator UvrY
MINVFIVDKHKIFREGLKSIISTTPGIEIKGEADSYEEILKIPDVLNGDVVLFDLSIKSAQAIQTIKALKSNANKIQILAVSTFPEEEKLVELFQAGADGFIEKRSSMEELLKAIRNVSIGGKFINPVNAVKLVRELNRHIEYAPHKVLTEKEYNVMLGIAKAKKLKQIAKELRISIASVSLLRRKVLEKLNLQTNADIFYYALNHKLLK